VLKDRDDTRWRTSVESKQREKYETNQINQNISGKLSLRGITGHRGCADDNDNNEHRPSYRHNDNPTDDDQFGGQYCHLHPELGLLHVPNDVGCGARTVLLHQGYSRGRSSRSCCTLVGDPPGHASHRLLLNSGQPGRGAQSSIGSSACPCS
jgi:hypothetical protein